MTHAQPTTAIKKKAMMQRAPLENCHDGTGALDWTEVTQGSDSPGRLLRFMHDNVLPPGASIGIHAHSDDEEYYYFIEGKGVMTLDGAEHNVEAGDITGVFPGGSHGLENRSTRDLRVVVFSVAAGNA